MRKTLLQDDQTLTLFSRWASSLVDTLLATRQPPEANFHFLRINGST